jgi:hypothetical protein
MKEYGIDNYTAYTEGMRKSLLDKAFFMDKIDARVIVDYGCADGTLINFLSSLFPELQYIGYDIDEKMLDRARETCSRDNVIFTSDWYEVISHSLPDLSEGAQRNPAAIVLSSVIHEVYAYGTRKEVDEMWDRVFRSGFDYIVIRDMVPSVSMDTKSDINDVKQLLRKANPGHLREFEQVWGSIEQNKNLIHFLLKYRYTDNWSREVRENYFPLTREELISSIPDAYEIDFHEHFRLPFAVKTVKQDFGITLRDNTHLKLILEGK